MRGGSSQSPRQATRFNMGLKNAEKLDEGMERAGRHNELGPHPEEDAITFEAVKQLKQRRPCARLSRKRPVRVAQSEYTCDWAQNSQRHDALVGQCVVAKIVDQFVRSEPGRSEWCSGLEASRREVAAPAQRLEPKSGRHKPCVERPHRSVCPAHGTSEDTPGLKAGLGWPRCLEVWLPANHKQLPSKRESS